MSEYQYYEFQAIDRPLDRAAQEALRSISSRARITATSFTNHYHWGDLSGDPRKFMEQWFDFHLYVSNWGSRRLMMRVPQHLLNRADLDPFLRGSEWVEVWTAGENLIVDFCDDEQEPVYDDNDDSGWFGSLAPLRADLLSGDLRLFYLVWLMAVQYEWVSDDDVEPLPGIGPLTGALEAFAQFFRLDPDLVEAAAELGAEDAAPSSDDLREALTAIPEREKTEFLLRVADGDAHVAAELRKMLRKSRPAPAGHRTAAVLRRRAREIAEARERAEAERREAEHRREAAEAEQARRVRLRALKRRGAEVWREVEEEIGRRNPSGYDRAASLLSDLQALAAKEGTQTDFELRLAAIRGRHENKLKFLERLVKLGC